MGAALSENKIPSGSRSPVNNQESRASTLFPSILSVGPNFKFLVSFLLGAAQQKNPVGEKGMRQ